MSTSIPHSTRQMVRPLIGKNARGLELSAHEAMGFAALVFPAIFNYHKSRSASEAPAPQKDDLLRMASKDAVRAVEEMVKALRNFGDADDESETRELRILNSVVKPLVEGRFLEPKTIRPDDLRNVMVSLAGYLECLMPIEFLPQRLHGASSLSSQLAEQQQDSQLTTAQRKRLDQQSEKKSARQQSLELKRYKYRLNIFTDFFLFQRENESVRQQEMSSGFKVSFPLPRTAQEILEEFRDGIRGVEIVLYHDDLAAFVKSYRKIKSRKSTQKAGKASADERARKKTAEKA